MTTAAGNVGDNQGGVSVSAAADFSSKLSLATNFGAIGGPQINASASPPANFFAASNQPATINYLPYVVGGVALLGIGYFFLRH